MPKYFVAMHEAGSLSEAMEPIFSAVVETEAEAKELEEKIWDLAEGHSFYRSGRVIITEIDEPVSVEDALTKLEEDPDFDHFFYKEEEPEDEDEKELNRKVDGLMAGETAALNELFSDTYHTKRKTTIQPEFTRYPTEPIPYTYPTAQGPIPLGGEDDPFGDMTDEEVEALSDDEFLAILRKSRGEE